MKEMHLTQIDENQTVVIKEIIGGHGVARRLEALGIRPGKKITKISSHFWHGPVTVLVGKAKVAIGHGMAEKIMVEVVNEYLDVDVRNQPVNMNVVNQPIETNVMNWPQTQDVRVVNESEPVQYEYYAFEGEGPNMLNVLNMLKPGQNEYWTIPDLLNHKAADGFELDSFIVSVGSGWPQHYIVIMRRPVP